MEKLGLNLPWLLAQLINFILVLVLLRMLVYKPVLSMLGARKKKIAESLEYSEKVKADAAVQQKDFERKYEEQQREFNARLQSSQQVAEQERQRIIEEARADAEKIREAAKGDVEYERKQMVSELRQQVIELSMLGAQRVIGGNMDQQKSHQLVENFLNEVDFGAPQKPGLAKETAGA